MVWRPAFQIAVNADLQQADYQLTGMCCNQEALLSSCGSLSSCDQCILHPSQLTSQGVHARPAGHDTLVATAEQKQSTPGMKTSPDNTYQPPPKKTPPAFHTLPHPTTRRHPEPRPSSHPSHAAAACCRCCASASCCASTRATTSSGSSFMPLSRLLASTWCAPRTCSSHPAASQAATKSVPVLTEGERLELRQKKQSHQPQPHAA